MNNLIINLTFGMLTIISLTGLAIIISNAVKVKKLNAALKKKLHEINKPEIAYIRTEPIYKLIPIHSKKDTVPKPVLLLPAPMHKMKIIN